MVLPSVGLEARKHSQMQEVVVFELVASFLLDLFHNISSVIYFYVSRNFCKTLKRSEKDVPEHSVSYPHLVFIVVVGFFFPYMLISHI